MFENLQTNLVAVQFESRHRPGTYTGQEFTYIADVALQTGDIVNVPTKFGDRKACVSRIDVSIGEIQCRVGELRHITEAPIVGGDLFSGFF